jgi:hypothetical protein
MKYGLLSTCRALLKPSWVRRGCVEKHTNPIVTSPKMNSRDVREVESCRAESEASNPQLQIAQSDHNHTSTAKYYQT